MVTYKASRLFIAVLKAASLSPASRCRLVEYERAKPKCFKMLLFAAAILLGTTKKTQNMAKAGYLKPLDTPEIPIICLAHLQ